jgi:phosphoribosyl 1,2-cyclic phosphodiesterase
MTTNYIRFWGVRGSYPAPFASHLRTGGNTSCVEVRAGDHILICDGGTGIIPLGHALMEQHAIREGLVVLTHYHWDHISGLPFFEPAFTRGWRIKFFGPGQNQAEIGERIAEQMKAPYFPVETEKWLAEVEYLEDSDGFLRYGPISIERFYVHHPGSTYGYRIRVGKRTIVYASDNELGFINRAIDQRKQEFDEPEQQLLEAMKEDERRRSIEFMRNVDILIHDAQYTPLDYEKKRGWGHSCYVDTVEAAMDAEVGQLFLFHFDPTYPDDRIDLLHRHAIDLIKARRNRLVCKVAHEGYCIDLDNDL